MVNVVLKDGSNRILRTFLTQDEGVHELIMNKESRRIELVKSTAQYEKDGIEFSLIEKLQVKSLKSKDFVISSNLSLGLQTSDMKTLLDSDMAQEDDKKTLTLAYKYSSAGHAAVIGTILLVGFIMQTFFSKPEEKVMEVVVLPKMEQKQEAKKEVVKVKVAETIKAVKPQVRPKTITKILPKPKVRTATITQGMKQAKNAEIGTLRTLEKIGGIGTTTDAKNKGTGYGKNSGAFGSGNSFGGGLGSGVGGGMKDGLTGKGLVGGLSGNGSRSFGAHGYGEGKFGGGRIGRGGGSLGSKVGNIMVPAFEDSEINGGLTREQVEAVVRRNSGQLLFCYEKALQSQRDLRGRVTTQWVVGPNGGVTTAKVASTSLNNKQVENCVIASIKGWKFPKPVGGVHVDVSYPFDFGRLNLMAKEN
jgi:TonB family protein